MKTVAYHPRDVCIFTEKRWAVKDTPSDECVLMIAAWPAGQSSAKDSRPLCGPPQILLHPPADAAEFSEPSSCDDWIILRRFGKLIRLKDAEIGGRQEEGSVMRRSSSGLSFLFALLSAAPAFAQQEPQVAQQGPQVAQPASRVARQGSNFDRVSTLRHEVTVGPAQVGQGAPSQRQTSSPGSAPACLPADVCSGPDDPTHVLPRYARQPGPQQERPATQESYLGTRRVPAPRHVHELRRSEDEFCPISREDLPVSGRRMPIRETGKFATWAGGEDIGEGRASRWLDSAGGKKGHH